MTSSREVRVVRLDGAKRKEQIVEAYADLIATKGFSNVSIRDIAQRVGISTGTLLHHFATKEKLLIATLLFASEGFHSHARQALKRGRDPEEKLRRLVEAMLSTKHDVGWRVWIAFWHEAALNPVLSVVASERNRRWEAMIESTIEEGLASELLHCEDAKQSASELAALINGVAVQRLGEPRQWPTHRAIAVVEKLIDDWSVARRTHSP